MHIFGQSPQTENRLKKLIRIWRVLHEYVDCVHDPEKEYKSLSVAHRPGGIGLLMRWCTQVQYQEPDEQWWPGRWLQQGRCGVVEGWRRTAVCFPAVLCHTGHK